MRFLFHQSFWYSIGMKGFCNQLFGKKCFDHHPDCGAYKVEPLQTELTRFFAIF